jgi:hypothetical protein
MVQAEVERITRGR